MSFVNVKLQDSWYHLHCTPINGQDIIVCFCPAVNIHQECVHTRFVGEFKAQFPDEDIDNQGNI